MEESNKAQHREFVQNIITKMNTNSFQIKGMMITISAAFLAIYGSNPQKVFIIIPVPIIFLFWLMDTYYLQLERKFRGIYNDICDITPLSEKLTLQNYGMDPSIYKGADYNYLNVLFSKANAVLYLSLICSFTVTYFILK